MQLAMAGREVALVEKGGLGGQCLHHGCMVVCALNDIARHLHESRTLVSLGILDRSPQFSFPKTLSGMASVQQKIARVLDAETRNCGVQVWQGSEGRVEGNSLYVDGERVDTEKIIVATGSLPRIPDIPGIHLQGVYHPHALSSMREVPDHLLVIGGGIMAAEFAFIFREFGAEVDLAVRSTFLKELNPRLRDLAKRDLDGVQIHEGCRVSRLEGEGMVSRAVLITAEGEVPVPCDGVFLAAGLVPNSSMVTGIVKGADGRIIVDRSMATSHPDVYACGDVTGSRCLTPVARYEGTVAAASILGRDPPPDGIPVPQSMNLASEYAFVEGDQSDDEVAFASPGPAGPGTFWSVPNGRTGMASILVSRGSGDIHGVYTAGPAAGIIAAYQSFLMRLGVTVHEFNRFMEVHPMTDGVYPLMKYASYRLNREKDDGSEPGREH
jgi:dihydrolipoamide dehydrogenase